MTYWWYDSNYFAKNWKRILKKIKLKTVLRLSGCTAVVDCWCLDEARTDLKHSVLSEWSVLSFKQFQAMKVLGVKRVCVAQYCTVAVCSICCCSWGFHLLPKQEVSRSTGPDLVPVFLGSHKGIAGASTLTALYKKVRHSRSHCSWTWRVGRFCLWRRPAMSMKPVVPGYEAYFIVHSTESSLTCQCPAWCKGARWWCYTPGVGGQVFTVVWALCLQAVWQCLRLCWRKPRVRFAFFMMVCITISIRWVRLRLLDRWIPRPCIGCWDFLEDGVV